MSLVGAYVRDHRPRAKRVRLTVNEANLAARRAYASGGFAETGEVVAGGPAGPQLVLVLDL